MPGFNFFGYSLESILFSGALLLIVSVLSSRISSKFGLPSLLCFLAVGMLAGSEGPGGIEFDNYPVAFAVGSLCLAIIIFDGGLRTPWRSVRSILPLGISLSFVATVVTCLLTGLFAHYVFELDWMYAMLLGAIVSSTDAAAVFNILRSKNLALKGTLKQTLEFEAGSNDPVAVFLTVSILSFTTVAGGHWSDLISMFFLQAGVGLAMGWVGGRAIRWLLNHSGLEYEGLYGVMLLSSVVLLFAATTVLHGSGFLAVYVAGLYLASTEFLHKGSVVRFHDGIAWVAQIAVFLTMGLLAFPSHLLAVWKEGVILSIFLMLVARPLSVLVAAPTKALGGRERIFVSWVGLRGVAPIILAILPLSFALPNAEHYFNLVFFVVLTSVITQGVSIPWIARKLGVTEKLVNSTGIEPGMLPEGFVTAEIHVLPGAPAVHQRIVATQLPAGVLLTSIERDGRYLVPRGDTVILEGDRIRGLARPSNIAKLAEIFGEATNIT